MPLLRWVAVCLLCVSLVCVFLASIVAQFYMDRGVQHIVELTASELQSQKSLFELFEEVAFERKTGFYANLRFYDCRDGRLHVDVLNLIDGAGALMHDPRWDGKRYFLAALFHQSETVIPNFIVEVVKLLYILGPSNCYVSVYESGSSDRSKPLLEFLDQLLSTMGVDHSVVLSDYVRGPEVKRIEFLASIRNLAIQPLVNGTAEKRGKMDYVIFFSDVYQCSTDILELLLQPDADMACGTDWSITEGELTFYDTWVAKDIEGNMWAMEFPYVRHPPSWERFEQNLPFQVVSCWNGITVIKAKVFTELRIAFHGGHNNTHSLCECAETEWLPRDLWREGLIRTVVVPSVRVAYEWAAYERVLATRPALPARTADRVNGTYTVTSKPQWVDVLCCPIQGLDHFVDLELCARERLELNGAHGV